MINNSFNDYLRRRMDEDFASTFGVKNQWVNIDSNTLKKDPSIAQELIDLLNGAYSKIGGHADFRTANDLVKALDSGQISLIKANDIDEEPGPDVMGIYKNKPGGLKAVASAAKPGSQQAKDFLIQYKTKSLNQPGQYAEVSDAMAKVLLSSGVPVVQDEHKVKQILAGKEIEWHGKHPNLESFKDSVAAVFGRYNGWYSRFLGDGKSHVKIMVGIPKTQAPANQRNL